jgi:uncharacterized protein
MAALITFPAADIHLEGAEVDVVLPAAWLVTMFADTEVTPRTDPAGKLSGRLSRSGNDIVVRTRVHAKVELPCARCLEPTPADVDTDLSLLLQPVSPKGSNRGGDGPEYEFSSAEADTDVYDGETVVLDPFVRDAILLEVPTFPLCRESCPGIATQAAVEEERAPDPRLAALGAFRARADGPATLEDLVAAADQRGAAMGRKPRLRSHQRGPRRRKR